jgi:ubiquinone biosynthesis protein
VTETLKPPDDLAFGAFSDDPPWVLDLDAITWTPGLDAVRAACRGEVPLLTQRRRLPPGLRMARVSARLATAVGGWALFERRKGEHVSRAGISRRLRIAATDLGSTYIKLGQIISAGEGLFPEELVNEFKLCRDRVPAESFDTVRAVIEQDLHRPLESVFERFDTVPLAAASIAQVHAATLRTGERVVVKVQRPQVAKLVRQDLAVMSWLAPLLVGRIPIAALANPPALVELFAETITEELDFRLEAQNMLDVARVLAELGQRGYVVPRPHPTLVTRRVLVMERLSGFAFDDVESMKRAGIDTTAVIRTGMIAFMEGAMIYGVFHGDLHAGNLFVLPDGRTALLDFGIVGRLTEPRRLAFLRLMMGATTNDVKGQLAALRDLGALPPDTDLEAVIRDLRLDQPAVDPTSLSGEELVHEIQRTVKALLGYGARLPKELMLYVKNMVFLDGAIARLAPDLDLLAEITTISAYFATHHGDRLAADIGIHPMDVPLDLEGVKASFGVDSSTETLTYRDLQKRRELIGKRLRDRSSDSRPS